MINLLPTFIVIVIWLAIFFMAPRQKRGLVNVIGAMIIALVSLAAGLSQMGAL